MEPYSVLMSVYVKEKPEYLRMSIDSMIHQTVEPDEIVIVEDGPLTNELYDVLDEYESKYPKLIQRCRNEVNLGLGMALNKGLAACKNELVARMDTDDISKPERCELQLKRFEENPELSIVGAHIDEFVGDIENVVSTRKVPLKSEEIYKFGKRRNPFNHPVVMYRKSKVLGIGGYADMPKGQDWDLFGRLLYGDYKGENIDKSLLWFRFDENMVRRRKSFGEVKTSIETAFSFYKMGYASVIDFAFTIVVYVGIYVLPDSAVRRLYQALRH